jgi:hypothetical protein
MFGNLIGIYKLVKKNLIHQTGPKNMFIYLLIVDTLYLQTIIKIYFHYGFDIDFTSNGNNLWFCKLFSYFSYSISSVPPILLTYITMERYICIKYSNVKIINIYKSQFCFLMFTFFFNFFFYMPILSLTSGKEFMNSSSNQLHLRNYLVQCTFVDSGQIPLFLILVNRIILPFSLLIYSTCMLIKCLIESRKRIISNYTMIENTKFKRDIKIAFISITMNIFVLILNLPVIIIHFCFPHLTTLYLFTFYLFIFSYGIHFYLILISRRIFTNEFIQVILPRNVVLTFDHLINDNSFNFEANKAFFV